MSAGVSMMAGASTNDPRTERSLRHSVRDGVATSVMTGGGESYFSAYAIYLRAGPAQVSWLAALPALLGSLTQLFSAWLAGRAHNRRHLILAGTLLQAASWLPIIWLPHLFPDHAVALLIACVVVYFVGGNLMAPPWSSLMGDLVPESRRGRFFARRNRYSAVAGFLALLAAGTLLHWLEAAGRTRAAFTAIFLGAMLARLVSIYHLAHMYEPSRPAAITPLPPPRQLLARMRHSRFARFVLAAALLQGASAIASPLFTVYMLRDLGFTYLEFTLSSAACVLTQSLSLGMWGRLCDTFGNRRTLLITATLIPLLPLLWLAAPGFRSILLVQMLSGFCWSGFSLGAGNYLYDVSRPERRAAYSAFSSVVNNSAIFGGALLGGYLALAVPSTIAIPGGTLEMTSGLWGAMLLSAAARGAVVLLLLRRVPEVRAVRTVTTARLLWRMSPFRYVQFLLRRPPRRRGGPSADARAPAPPPDRGPS
jgi:MFS family permease